MVWTARGWIVALSMAVMRCHRDARGRGGGDRGRGKKKGRGGHAAVEAEGPGGKEGERREPEAADPRADPFNPAECDQASALVIADTLEVLKEEGEQAGRMAVRGGQRQVTAPNVPADAMKSIRLEVQREEKAKEGKGGQGSERQATRVQADTQGRRSARVQEGRERSLPGLPGGHRRLDPRGV